MRLPMNVPKSQILRFVHSWVWEEIVWSGSDVLWGKLFVDATPVPGQGIHALVLMPLRPEWAINHDLGGRGTLW
jgi:hypothetical protein